MQLAGEIVPSLKALKKEGDTGRKIITKYTRIGTVFLATIQSFFAATLVYNQGIVVVSHFEFITSAVACIVGGTMFLMWLGEQITERGIGNGISLIITAGIIAGIPRAVGQLWSLMSTNPLQAIALAVGALVLVYAVVCFESALRKVPIHYAKRQVMQAQNTHLPFKLNMAGVIPPILHQV